MKVLMVISQFYPIVGGAEKQAFILAKELAAKGIAVKVVTGWWNLRSRRRETIDRIEVFRNFSCWGMLGIRGIRVLGGLIYMLSLTFYLLLHRREYDIIHVHQALYPAFISLLIGKRILRKGVLVKAASSGKTNDIKLLREFPTGRLQSRYLLRNVGPLVAVSQRTENDFREFGIPSSRIVRIPNGVEISRERSFQNEKVGNVVTATRFSKEKGVDVLLRAWVRVVSGEKGVRLTLIGEGPLESEMKEIAESLGIRQDVEFTGFVANVGEYFENSDIFVLPSRAEGMSNALLEAMSYGIPCIATCVGANGELLGAGGQNDLIPTEGFKIGKNGLLVNPEDIIGLAEAILYFIRNPSVREEMGKKARAFVLENYSIDLIATEYVALYESMLNKR